MPPSASIKTLRTRERLLAWLLACALKLWAHSLRWDFVDQSGITQRKNHRRALIWCFWHNNIIVAPSAYRRSMPWRSGSVLTSASRDGAFLEAVLQHFGVGSVRGSSSRGSHRALRQLRKVVEQQLDIAITPDGPRGPRYHLAAGVIHLAEQSQAPIQPISYSYSRARFLPSWDALRLPWPFSKVTVTYHPLYWVKKGLSEAEREQERQRLEQLLLPPAAIRAKEPKKDRR